MARFKGKVAVVFGASDPASMVGVIAPRMREEGVEVVDAARREDRVHALADAIGAEAATCDITRDNHVAAPEGLQPVPGRL